MPVDLDQLRLFLKTLYQNKRTDGHLTVVALPSKKSKRANDEAFQQTGQPLTGLLYRSTHLRLGPQNGGLLIKFLEKNNGVRGLYFRQGRMRSDSAGKERIDVVEVCNAWVDIDTRKQIGTCPDANDEGQFHKDACVDDLLADPHPPTIIIDSGGGIQAHWVLSKSETDEAGFAKIEMLNRLLAQRWGGDDVSGVQGCMRLPGALNVNYEPPVPALVRECAPDRTHDLDLLINHTTAGIAGSGATNVQQQAVLLKEIARSLGAKGGGKTADDWAEIKGNLAVSGERNNAVTKLAGFVFRAQPEATVEEVVVWILNEGCTLEPNEVLAIVERVANKHMRSNDVVIYRTKEDRAAVEGPEAGGETVASDTPPETPNEAAAEDQEAREAPAGVNIPDPANPLVVFGAALQAAAADDKKLAPGVMAKLAARALRYRMQTTGSDIMHHGEQFFVFYPMPGIWMESTTVGIDQLLRDMLMSVYTLSPTGKEIDEARRALMLDTHIEESPWDSATKTGQLVLCGNGVAVDLETGFETRASKDMYLREHDLIGASWDTAATCPTWDSALSEIFEHVPDAERPAVMAVVEDWLGSILIRRNRARAMSKMLILYGDKRTGKSTILNAARAVLGVGRHSGASLDDLHSEFKYETLYGSMAWLTDENVEMGALRVETLKKIVTNEEVGVNRKFERKFTTKLNLTVGFATNTIPTIPDASDAMWDRAVFIHMGTVFDEKRENKQMLDTLTAERDGILQRMVRAAMRLLSRGQYDIPDYIVQRQAQIKLTENPTLDFLQHALAAAPQARFVKVKDINTALQGYIAETMSVLEARKMRTSPKWVATALQGAYPDSTTDRKDHGSIRVKRGLVFTDAGLKWLNRGWQLEDSTYTKDTARIAVAQGNDTPWLAAVTP